MDIPDKETTNYKIPEGFKVNTEKRLKRDVISEEAANRMEESIWIK